MLPEEKDLFFLKLELRKAGRLIDENLYWLTNIPRSYEKLNELKKTEVALSVQNRGKGKVSIKLSNPAQEPAFFIRLKVVDQKNEPLLPAYFSDNYITLLPGEDKNIEMEIPVASKENVKLVVEGWNVPESSVKLQING